jgi:hypothetical protein
VRKRVDRATQDIMYVMLAYDGIHNHDVPAARRSRRNSVNKPCQTWLNCDAVVVCGRCDCDQCGCCDVHCRCYGVKSF